jgi:hypothetical protein
MLFPTVALGIDKPEATVNLLCGVLVPIPTFPVVSITNLGVLLLFVKRLSELLDWMPINLEEQARTKLAYVFAPKPFGANDAV